MTALENTLRRHMNASSLVVLVFASWIGVSVAQNEFGATKTQPENRLVLQQLEFIDGNFHQLVQTSTGDGIRGKWAAKIDAADGRHMCSGGGVAPYAMRDKPIVLSPSHWTGGRCSLSHGEPYVATATWQWANADGQTRSMTERIEFVFSDPNLITETSEQENRK